MEIELVSATAIMADPPVSLRLRFESGKGMIAWIFVPVALD
jgi:hypothetical protein